MKKAAAKVWQIIDDVIRAVLNLLMRAAGRELSESAFGRISQFVKFGIVGVMNTMISLIVYYIFVFISKELYLIGSAAGFVLSVLNAFYWNSNYVFKKNDEKLRTLIRTFIAYGSNLLIGTLMLWLLVDKCGLSHFIAPMINLMITVPLNFLLNKFWVMKKSHKRADEERENDN
ncbi:MAG: GtrA family protein [Ruminococcus sp.]|nr:GtrA family protein [Ruminococcus sp.]